MWKNRSQPDLYHRILKSQELGVWIISGRGKVHKWKGLSEMFLWMPSHALCHWMDTRFLPWQDTGNIFSREERRESFWTQGKWGVGVGGGVGWLPTKWWMESSLVLSLHLFPRRLAAKPSPSGRRLEDSCLRNLPAKNRDTKIVILGIPSRWEYMGVQNKNSICMLQAFRLSFSLT